MLKRILVPLDGSVPAGAVVNPAFVRSFPNPSLASSLVDGLEAETQIDRNAITDEVEYDGIKTTSLRHEIQQQKPFWRSQTR